MFSLFVSELMELKLRLSFFKHLTHLHQKGFSLSEALRFLVQHPPYAKKRTFSYVYQSVCSGHSFFESVLPLMPSGLPFSFSSQPVSFKPLVFFEGLISYLSFQETLLHSFLKQLRYPFVLFISCLGILLLFFTTLLPSFGTLISALPHSEKSFLYLFFQFYSRHSYFIVSFSLLFSLCSFFFFIFFLYRKLSFSLFTGYGHYFFILSLMIQSGLSLKESLARFSLSNTHPCALFHAHILSLFYSGADPQELLVLLEQHCVGFSRTSFSIPLSSYGPFFSELSLFLISKDQDAVSRVLFFIQPLLLLFIALFIFILVSFVFFPILNSFSSYL